ncbi:MAG: hypothetical protein IT183_06870 [Acidobacteria bacterium]|nr:hypothetical protein [Acidobacteriota bacterium]
MAGFASLDELISEMAAGKLWRANWNKLTHAVGTQAAGTWYALPHSTGNPAAMTLGVVGTNLAFHAACDRSTGALYHGGDVASETKHITNASAFSAAATTMPAVFMLVDLLGWYPVSTTTTTGNQALVNSKTFSATAATPAVLTIAAGWDIQEYTPLRFTTTTTLPTGLALNTTYYWHRTAATTGNVATSLADLASATYVACSDTGTGTHTATVYLGDRAPSHGAGVQAFLTPSTALGAGTPNIQLTYTNSAGTGSRTTPTTLPISNATAPIGQIEYSGTGAGKFGPFVPLAGGDAGIRQVDQFSYNVTHTSGTTNVCLCRPLLTLPMTTVGVAAERDLVNQLPSLPRVYDGACLVWLMYAGAATPVGSAFYGHLDLAWS